MIRKMKLKAEIRKAPEGHLIATAKLFDGTPFELHPREYEVILNDEIKPGKWVEGWVYVDVMGQQGDACYITLPQPSTVHGKQVSVNQYQLMPIEVTLESFGAQPSH